MKIVTLSYEYPPIGGGGSVVAAALAEQLVRMGHTVDVVTSRMRGLAATETVNGVGVHRTGCWRRHRHYTTTPELATTLMPAYRKGVELIRRVQPDVLHAHFVVPSGLVTYLLARRFGLPYVLTAHGSDIPAYNPDRFERPHALARPMWRRIVRGAAGVVSPSAYLARLIRNQLDVAVDIVPNGYAPAASAGCGRRRLVLVVARLFPRKGVQHFIESIRDLESDWEFVIAGDGPHRGHLEVLAKTARPAIRFIGFVDKSTLRGLYEQARILVFPSTRENFPMVLLEAMDAGCAVITTDAEGCAEVVADAGIVVPAADAGAIRRALDELMHSETRCEALGDRAHARAELFRWPRIADRYVDVLRDALGPASGTRRELG